MSVVLFRVDDRLIHGQVTVAWGAWLSPDRIVLVNDEVATTEWKREIYAEADAMGAAITIATVAEFADAMAAGEWERERVIAVFESPADLLEAVEAGVSITEANIGGMHHTEGKREVLPFVYVDDADVEVMNRLVERGVRLEARDVPQARSVDLTEALLRHGE